MIDPSAHPAVAKPLLRNRALLELLGPNRIGGQVTDSERGAAESNEDRHQSRERCVEGIPSSFPPVRIAPLRARQAIKLPAGHRRR
jgi:hypothetical protein